MNGNSSVFKSLSSVTESKNYMAELKLRPTETQSIPRSSGAVCGLLGFKFNSFTKFNSCTMQLCELSFCFDLSH